MMKLQWTTQTLQDIRYIHDYIAEDDPQAAKRMVTRIKEAGLQLQKYPQPGKPGRVPDTRELILAKSPYILAYIWAKDSIQVASVLHSAMRWPDSFQDLP